MQVLGGAAYIYDVTNFGLGVGFSANSNHQGNFLLVCLILLGAVVADTPSMRRRDTRFASRVMGGAAGLVLVVGVLLSGSLACYLFLAPVLIAVFLMQRPDVVFARWQVALACALAVAGVVGVLFYGSDNDLVKKGAIQGLSRGEFLANGLVMLRDLAPFGSGLGTFVQLYPSYEAAETVGNTFVNHAHNDWLELLIETGAIGAVALGLFLLWFVRRSTAIWGTERTNALRCAGTAIVALELVHSLGDYPLRTAALSAMLALGCALMVAQGQSHVREGRSKAANRSPAHEPLGRVGLQQRGSGRWAAVPRGRKGHGNHG